ncbi:NAD(P)H-dependent oxidoreductase [Vagococcus entomophilus]|nr:NAD(P)H-dependent oxidoreductase [Vagococcus entomophilus]
MKTLIIVSHPNVQDSTTQSFLKKSAALEEVTWHHLENNYTYTTIDSVKERNLLVQHDRIILQFPLYWYSAPAMLKQWMDVVLSEKLSLRGKEFGLVVTIGVKEKAYQAGGSEQFTLSELLRPFQAIARHFQMIFLPVFTISKFSYMTEEAYKKLLIDYRQYVSIDFPETFAKKEAWFLDRLNEVKEKASQPEHLVLLEEISRSFTHNQETLEELVWTLEEMK